jgi:pilus assembly protein CpaE
MSRVVLLSDLAEAAELVAGACSEDDVEVIHLAVAEHSTAELCDAIAGTQASVVVIGPELSEEAAIEAATALDEQLPGIGRVLWAEPTATLLMKAIAAGVRGVLPANPSLSELRDAVRSALQALSRSQVSVAEPPPPTGRVVVITSPKGGTGKTTVAANLAVALASDGERTVALVDLDLQFGDVEYALRLRPDNTMTDAVKLGDNLDTTSVKGYLTPHPSGVFALCAPGHPADAESLDHGHVRRVVELLSQIFDYVVVDTAAGIDDHMLNAVELATDVVLLVATDVPTVRSAQKSLAVFRQLGHDDRPWHIVLNRADAKVGLGPEDVEEAIGVKADIRVPESRAVGASMNHGSPVVESQPKSPPAKALISFARRFVAPSDNNAQRRRFERAGV